MDTMIQVAVLAVAVIFCAAVVRRGAPEMGILLVLCAGIAVIFLLLDGVAVILAAMERLANLAQLDSAVVAPVWKTVAIAILTKITGELCRSANEGGLAAFVEVAGTVTALAVALPLVEAVVQMMTEILT